MSWRNVRRSRLLGFLRREEQCWARANPPGMKRWVALLLVLCLALPGRPDPPPDEVDFLLLECWFTIRSADYGNARQIYKFLTPVEHLKNPPERWHVFLGPDALAPLFLDYGEGKFTDVLAAAPGARKAAKARKSSTRELEILLLQLSAAQSCGRVTLVKQLLPEAEKLAATAPGARGTLTRYILYTMRASYDNEAHFFTVEEARARANEATGLLKSIRYDEDYRRNVLIEPILARDSLMFWMRRLTVRGLYDELYAQYQALYPPLLKGARETVPEADNLNQMSAFQILRCSQAETLFEMASRSATLGIFTPEKAYGYVDPVLKDCEDEYSQFEQGAKEQSLLIPWLRGPVSRTVTIGHLGRALITLERLREHPEQVTLDERMAMGDDLQRALHVVQGTGDDDLRTRVQLAFLEGLILAQPPGWGDSVEDILTDVDRMWGSSPNKLFPYTLALALKGKLRARQKRNAEAIHALSKCLRLVEGYAQESGSSEQMRSNWSEEYELLARLQLEAGQTASAADTLDRQSQLSTVSSFPLRSLNKPELASAAALQQKMAGLAQQADSDPHAAVLLAQTRSEFYQTLADLQKKEPAYGRLSVRPNNFSRLQPVLPADTAVVQLFPAENELYLFVATHDALKIRSVPVPAKHLHDRVERFRQHVMAYGREGGKFDWASPTGADLSAILIELGDALWAPIQPDLEGKSVVVFIPTGPLYYLPMQVLARPGNGRPHLLVEEKAVAVAAKSSDLESLERPAKGGRAMLALADPDGSLDGARQEAADVAGLFPGSEVCLGADATADHLARLKPDVGYLHFATHGLLDISQPTDSYLLMAGADKQLTVTEIAGLDLAPVRLVTLSACQSALAERQPEIGAELTSLADAFAFAGSPSLVASLWKVSDTSTRSLMVEFYRQLAAGKGRGEALRLAEVALLQQPDTAHPFHWAGFELLGDWR